MPAAPLPSKARPIPAPALHVSHAVSPGAPSAIPAQPIPEMPDPLRRAIRATSAAMPDHGDDPEACLAAVIDAFQEFNPIDTIEMALVSQFVLLSAAFPHLMRRTVDPDLPPALQERLTRTALAITRTQDRILRVLRPENGVSLLAPREVWAAWKETLLREEAARAEARKAAEAEREATEVIEAAAALSAALAPRPGTARNDLLQSGEDLALAARRAGRPRDERAGATAGALFQRHVGEDLIAQAAKAAVSAAGTRTNAAKEPLAP